MVFPANSSSGGSARELEDDVEMEGAAMEILSILKGVGGDPYGLKRADPYLRNANPITRDRAFAADRGGNDVLVSELCTATAPVQNGLHGGACVFERMGEVPVLEKVVNSRWCPASGIQPTLFQFVDDVTASDAPHLFFPLSCKARKIPLSGKTFQWTLGGLSGAEAVASSPVRSKLEAQASNQHAFRHASMSLELSFGEKKLMFGFWFFLLIARDGITSPWPARFSSRKAKERMTGTRVID